METLWEPPAASSFQILYPRVRGANMEKKYCEIIWEIIVPG